ncbi:DUF5818 domain-containing protein [Novosphingobium huizhouense]|uniref:DUF5818 domain-containing protein n=1 Tax=Novosphingobium huizhouense TaxID=2866625 RepID=UPI001CD8DA93|nr:DUF5818 domain-containing protein [Novosphingobium huizhouense]
MGLRVRDGRRGIWRLDVSWPVRRLIGQRVIVEGMRAGFDLLDVAEVRPANSASPKRRWHGRFFAYITGWR